MKNAANAIAAMPKRRPISKEAVQTEGVQSDKVAETIDRLLVRLIPINEIAYSRRTANIKDQVGPFNPRQEAGFDVRSMEELESSIREDGLLEYPNVRPVKNGFQLLAGERRLRAINNLVKRDDLVYDEATDKKVRASVLYETVPCRVVKNADDMRAIRIAVQENGLHHAVSERDLVDLCEWMLDQDSPDHEGKMTRKDVSEKLGKSEAWLCHTLAFKTKLDQKTLAQLFDGEINRSFAIRLMEFPEDRRDDVKQAAFEVAQNRFEVAQERAEAEVAEAEVAHEQAVLISNTGGKNSDSATARVDRTKKRIAKAKDRVKVVEEQGVQLCQSDLDKGALQIGVDPVGTKGLSTKQLHDRWIDQLDESLAKEKVRCPKTQRVFPKRDILLVRAIAQAIADGGKNPLDALASFYMDQGGWGQFGDETFSNRLDKGVAAISGDLDEDDEDDGELDLDDDLGRLDAIGIDIDDDDCDLESEDEDDDDDDEALDD